MAALDGRPRAVGRPSASQTAANSELIALSAKGAGEAGAGKRPAGPNTAIAGARRQKRGGGPVAGTPSV